jgi:hypothetical protein
MGLSQAFLNQHIAEWEQRLHGQYYAHRERWPSRLFHHTPIENAVAIIRRGALLSRNDSIGRARDIAAAGVIDASTRAHRYARLYFRPRTPTQYHVEGIRRPHECRFGEATHAPILIMFVFDARRILTIEGTQFSHENMQTGAIEQGTEEFFRQIPFEKVYHEGGTSGDPSITRHRCAEVLAPSPLILDGALQWIYCRSHAEKETLLYDLGADAAGWEQRIVISDDLRVFEKRFPFVETVSISQSGIIFGLSSRFDLENISVRLEVTNQSDGTKHRFSNDSMAARPPGKKTWWFEADLVAGFYHVEVWLEEHSAYRNNLTLGDVPF